MVEPTSAPSLTEKVLIPETPEEAAQYLQALSRAGQSVVITGATRTETSLFQISSSALRGIKKYAPDDMYVTVGAGTPLSEIQTFLFEDNKQLAITSPWPNATIGGLVVANINAPQRMRYGAIRDNVLCATVALPDGRLIRTGRPLVKNVAGFDLTKAFIGSHGTLGLLTDLSLKVIVQPRMRRTLLVPVHVLADGLRLGQHMLSQALTASSILLSKGYTADDIPTHDYLLSYTAEGMAEDVQAELAQVRQVLAQLDVPEPLEVESTTGADIWTTLLGEAESTIVRAGVPINGVSASMQAQPELWLEEEGAWIADFGSGFVYAVKPDATELSPWLAALRQPALALKGYAIVLSAPSEEMSSQIDLWGYQPESLSVMRRLKAQWDPRGILNPGIFIV